MRTVGQVLKEERERKFYSLEEVEKTTKIRKELLEALEEGQYNKLPPSTFVQGFIKNYGKFLGLNTEKLLAVFRREFSEGKNPPRILESFKNPLDKKGFKLTPTRVLISVILRKFPILINSNFLIINCNFCFRICSSRYLYFNELTVKLISRFSNFQKRRSY